MPGGRPYTAGLMREHRNKAGGFWVAGADPEAARHARTGALPLIGLGDAALLSDGVSRLVDWYDYTWPTVFALLRSAGLSSLVTLLHEAERSNPRPGHRQRDDATAVYLSLAQAS
jgi:hypothetical protein